MNERIKILGIPFINTSFNKMIEILQGKIEKEEKAFVVTANPEIVMYTYEDAEYKETILNADYIVPDGHGILLASKILDKPIDERVTGYDLMMKLLELANKNRWRIFLLGGKAEVNRKAALNLTAEFPDLVLAGNQDGYFNTDDKKVACEIAKSNPDLIFVALGFPKQEKWILENISSFSKGVFIGVGGSVDVLAGEVKRAPDIWQNMKLEWLYRLLQQPSRWRRMLALPRFVIQVLYSKNQKKD
ncbi:WecB/TagA/CpsF family glycosyltransferase [Cytobacillus firmus]|uniref:WecB/TagA/CpsF family glycosyltransferase n=1 Tax=Cytobacillus firmus TaxID=1399 RepID=UPI00218C5529|nr:WecB/TagA/CpsF family glycosyltransferase [Cytobacillus firmus]URM33431.1 WecB/TagA/CpsF family glycosyltransferase [Cytobacillus firmus]